MKKIIVAVGMCWGLMVNAQQYVLQFENVHKLEGQVNTDAEESMPVFSKDSATLYFVRTFENMLTVPLK
jgi:hypothetical protein